MAIPGTIPGSAILGIPGIGPGIGAALISVHGPGTLGIPGIGPIGMDRVFTGTLGTGTVGTLTDRASIMVLPVALSGPVEAATTVLMPAAIVPAEARSVPMFAA